MSRPGVDLLHLLHEHRLRVFHTSDLMALSGLTPGATTHALRRLAERGLLYSLKRGLWANRLAEGLESFEAAPFLVASWPAYVSLYSALSRHGIVEEIPQTVYVVTSARAAHYQTPLGSFSVHHLPKELMWGYHSERSGGGSYPIAEPEKAFLDLVYLGLIPRSPIGLPYKRNGRWALNRKRLWAYARRFHFAPLMRYLRDQGKSLRP